MLATRTPMNAINKGACIMISWTKKAAIVAVGGLLLAGCASTDDVKRAQATADQALSAAQSAGQRADAAMSAANAASSKADQAMSAANAASSKADEANSKVDALSQKVDQMFAKGLRK
jgi:outer membrane murein-binding lipoprotein Lpp